MIGTNFCFRYSLSSVNTVSLTERKGQVRNRSLLAGIIVNRTLVIVYGLSSPGNRRGSLNLRVNAKRGKWLRRARTTSMQACTAIYDRRV